MAKKRQPFSFPELEARGRAAILRTPEEIRAEQEQLETQGSETLDDGPLVGNTTSPQVAKSSTRQVDKPTSTQVHKYTTHLRPETIKAIKRAAFESERKDYEIVQEAVDLYLRRLNRTT